jgi:hypothetical protein
VRKRSGPSNNASTPRKYDRMPKSLTRKTSPNHWMKVLISVEEDPVMIISSTYIPMKIEKVG